MAERLEKKRPRGVTIVAILMIISGVLFIIGGLSIASLTLLVSESGMGGVSAVLYGVSGVVIALGLASLVVVVFANGEMSRKLPEIRTSVLMFVYTSASL